MAYKDPTDITGDAGGSSEISKESKMLRLIIYTLVTLFGMLYFTGDFWISVGFAIGVMVYLVFIKYNRFR